MMKILYTFVLGDDVVMLTVLTLQYYDDENEHNDSDNKHDTPSIVYRVLLKLLLSYDHDNDS